MNSVLARWNDADETAAMDAMNACCGARRWAKGMTMHRPIASEAALFSVADRIWATMGEADWMQAFACHPRIGERKPPYENAQSVAWSREEQSSASGAEERILAVLAEGNVQYEEKFGFTYIVCATGKSAEEMLEILRRRLMNDRAQELCEAAEQQRQITQLRLRKWLAI